MNDGGWSFDGKDGWTLHPSQTERVRALHAEAMARIDQRNSRLPACRLCGQRALKLDAWGLCSKVTDAHTAVRRTNVHSTGALA